MTENQDKNQYQADIFRNRLSKNYRQLRKWARKNRISCYRLYDRDIPEIPLAVDLYEFLPENLDNKIDAMKFLNSQNNAISMNNAQSQDILKEQLENTYITIYLYERPYEKDDSEEDKWLECMSQAAAETTGVSRENIILKTRRKLSGTEEGRNGQYEKINTTRHISGITQEQGQLFKINLTDYLDSGLFFDHRPLRKTVRENCSGKSVLNLFCYTGSFSVYSAEGNARFIESVDLSNTYLEWAKENFSINGFDNPSKYIFTRQDVTGFLNQKNAEVANKACDSKEKIFTESGEILTPNRYDLIILDPPTFSNSKKTENVLDINRDWSGLCARCINILKPEGTLYFSTNSRRLAFSEDELKEKTDRPFTATDITSSTIPEDYRNSKIHRCWKITVN